MDNEYLNDSAFISNKYVCDFYERIVKIIVQNTANCSASYIRGRTYIYITTNAYIQLVLLHFNTQNAPLCFALQI